MERIPTVFIIGDGHSGSTLLTLILGAHSRMIGINEFSHYVRWTVAGEYCTCGALLSECPFWRVVFTDVDMYAPLLYERFLPFLFARGDHRAIVGGVEERVDVERYAKSTEDIFSNILRESGKAIIVDSSKDPVRAELLARRSTVIAPYFIHLVRDPRGVVYSNAKLGRSPYRFMVRWLAVNLRASLVKLRNPAVPSLTVRYEDLARDPERTLRRVCEFVGVTFESGMLSYRDVRHHTIAGNSIRFEKSNAIKEDLRWRTKLSVAPKLACIFLCGWLNSYYGIRHRLH